VRARDILPAYDTTGKKTRRLHYRGRETIFAGGQRYTAGLGDGGSAAYKWLVIHFAPASLILIHASRRFVLLTRRKRPSYEQNHGSPDDLIVLISYGVSFFIGGCPRARAIRHSSLKNRRWWCFYTRTSSRELASDQWWGLAKAEFSLDAASNVDARLRCHGSFLIYRLTWKVLEKRNAPSSKKWRRNPRREQPRVRWVSKRVTARNANIISCGKYGEIAHLSVIWPNLRLKVARSFRKVAFAWQRFGTLQMSRLENDLFVSFHLVILVS